MIDKPSFEIPRDLRELTEKNIEQARAAYSQLFDFFTQTMSAWSGATSSTIAPGFKAVQDRAIDFAKENAKASFDLASELASAKDIQQMLAVQNRHAQSQFPTYTRQVQELAQLTSSALGDLNLKR